MEALALFHQNFAVAESLVQLYQLFSGMNHADIGKELHLAICAHWKVADNTVVQHASNNHVSVLARSTTRIPESLTLNGGLDFLLRQAVVVACTCVESFFWDALRENVLTVIKARRTKADSMLRDITLTLGDYISIQQYQDPDLRLQQIILKNFERGTLYDSSSIDRITTIMTVRDFWGGVEAISGQKATGLKSLVGELITRRNQIAHRADRPADGEEADGHGLRPITLAWANARIQAAKTLVTAGADVMQKAINKLESDIQAAQEQEEARRLAREAAASEAAAKNEVASEQTATDLAAGLETAGEQRP